MNTKYIDIRFRQVHNPGSMIDEENEQSLALGFFQSEIKGIVGVVDQLRTQPDRKARIEEVAERADKEFLRLQSCNDMPIVWGDGVIKSIVKTSAESVNNG